MLILKKKILLASNSPRRKELLRALGVDFNILQTSVNENITDCLPENTAPLLAEKKARSINKIPGDSIVLAADTVVITGGKVLGKPANRTEALEMLRQLSGCTHEVYTSVSLRDANKIETRTDRTLVTFRQLTDKEIEYYVDRFQPYDKAGAYGVQEWMGLVGVNRIEGSYFTVVGLPTHLVYQMLEPYFVDE